MVAGFLCNYSQRKYFYYWIHFFFICSDGKKTSKEHPGKGPKNGHPGKGPKNGHPGKGPKNAKDNHSKEMTTENPPKGENK